MTSGDTYIIFELAGSAYGIRSADVLHVEMLEHITSVPNTAAAVEGVVFCRGQVYPALNLRVRFGLPRAAPTPKTRLIFTRALGRTIALIVDSAREFRSIPANAIRPIEQTLHGIHGNYVQGVTTLGDRLVLLLDVPAVLDLDDPAPLAAAEASAIQAAN